MKLDLGSGGNKRQGFLGVDISSDCDADIVHDLRVSPWPFDDASVEEVHCSHFFEHLTGAERVSFMEELYRIMQPGARAVLITPYWSSMDARRINGRRSHREPMAISTSAGENRFALNTTEYTATSTFASN